MRKINPKFSNKNSFRNSILMLLHHQDISNHPERTSNSTPYESTKPNEFEHNIPTTSVNIYTEQLKQVHTPKNFLSNQANILFINDRYITINPIKNTYTKLNNIFSQTEHNKSKQYILNKIII